MRNVRIDNEAGAQETLFNWAAYRISKYPELALLHHIPNGGKRDARTATNLKRQGVKAGVPDMCLPVARGGYHGLYIELKVGDNKPTKLQNEWLCNLNKQGFLAVVCYGWQQAAEMITTYLELDKTEKIDKNMSNITTRIIDTAKLKALLEEKHITQRELAEMIGVTEQAMSRYVNGTRTPRLTTYAAMTQALEIGINDLLTNSQN